MSKRIHFAALVLAGMMGTSLAGNGPAQAAGTSKSGSAAVSQGSGATGPGAGQPAGNAGTTSEESSPEAIKRMQARIARHEAIEKARRQAMDSTEAAFAAHEAAEKAGTSAIVGEKLQADKDAKAGKGDDKPKGK